MGRADGARSGHDAHRVLRRLDVRPWCSARVCGVGLGKRARSIQYIRTCTCLHTDLACEPHSPAATFGANNAKDWVSSAAPGSNDLAFALKVPRIVRVMPVLWAASDNAHAAGQGGQNASKVHSRGGLSNGLFAAVRLLRAMIYV